MKKSKFILGGGLSGLIYAWYNRDFTIISPDLGGMLNDKFFENIVYLHATEETENFLKDVGIEYRLKTQLIKYFSKGKFLNRDLTLDEKVSFIRKKMSDHDYQPKDVNLSTSEAYISIFEFNYSDLLEKLSLAVDHICDNVIKITKDEIITENTRFKYSKLVSTISAPVFWRLYEQGGDPELRSAQTTFVTVDRVGESVENSKFDLCYFIDSDSPLIRVSRRRRDQVSEFLCEFAGELSLEECANYLPRKAIIFEHKVKRSAIVFSDANNIPPKNVIFVGRFATWNHAYKQQDIIKASTVDFELQNLWNIQKRFTANFVDFNNIVDDRTREQLSKDYFVALIPEIAEAISEINFKQHKSSKIVDRSLLIEEMIDTFKYFLNILLVWDVTPQEFVDQFKKKSDKVEKQYSLFKRK